LAGSLGLIMLDFMLATQSKLLATTPADSDLNTSLIRDLKQETGNFVLMSSETVELLLLSHALSIQEMKSLDDFWRNMEMVFMTSLSL
jgi:hypothetical protein